MSFIFFNDTATTEIYTLSLHDALPIFSGLVWKFLTTKRTRSAAPSVICCSTDTVNGRTVVPSPVVNPSLAEVTTRSEEHTSELQSRQYLVCRLLLEKKKKYAISMSTLC